MECIKLITIRLPDGSAQKVPCGKCAFCLTTRRSEWMFRIHHEMRTQEHPGWFITLTYDEKHVKRVADGRLSLRFRDVQLLLKQIRKRKHYAKYICVGEYGSETLRPHYHLIIWTSIEPSEIQDIWARGRAHFGKISMASAMYTLKYIIQPKQRDIDGIEKTRAQFSRGLGLSYLSTSVYEYHTQDYENPILVSRIDGQQVALPRYYRRKIFTKYQLRKEGSRIKWESIRRRRKYMRELIARGVKNTKLYIDGLRSDQAKRIISKTKYTEVL